jgi:Flp pilus assembly protein TadD
VDVMRRATEQHPRAVPAHVQFGVVLFLAGKPQEAEVELRRALELGPDDGDALFNLSVFLRNTGRGPEARPYQERLRHVAEDPAKRAWAETELAQ